jgi:hypothetical protein
MHIAVIERCCCVAVLIRTTLNQALHHPRQRMQPAKVLGQEPTEQVSVAVFPVRNQPTTNCDFNHIQS